MIIKEQTKEKGISFTFLIIRLILHKYLIACVILKDKMWEGWTRRASFAVHMSSEDKKKPGKDPGFFYSIIQNYFEAESSVAAAFTALAVF